MADPASRSFDSHFRRVAGWLGIAVAGFGAAACGGSLAGTDIVGFLRPTPQPMPAGAAFGLALCGAALRLQLTEQGRGFGRFAAALAVAVAAAALLRVPGFDTMPLQAVAALAALGVGLFALHGKFRLAGRPIALWLGNLAVATALAGLFGLALLDLQSVTRPMLAGLLFVVCLLLLGLGVLFARPEDSALGALASISARGAAARRVFAGVALPPLLLAAAFVYFLNHRLLALPDAAFLLTVLLVLAGLFLALFSAEAAGEIDARREAAEQARLLLTARLHEQAAELQNTVALRTRELREANANLRAAAESNALLALVAQHTASGVVIADATGAIQWVNEAFIRLTGYELGPVVGRRPFEFLPEPGSEPTAVARLQEAVARGVSAREEIRIRRASGEGRWLLVELQPVREAGGQTVNLIVNCSDITGTRADQERLQHLNRRLELATQVAALGVWEWDARTGRSAWDARTCAIYGVPVSAAGTTTADWTQRLHPEDRTRAIAAIEHCMSHGDSFEQEFRIRRADDGSERIVQSRGVVQRDADGKVVRMTGTERDVTAERRSARNTEELNERLKLALRSSNYGVWEYDLVNRRREWDERVLEIYGFAPGEFDGSDESWHGTFHPEDRDAVVAKLRHVTEGRDTDYDLEFRIVRRDGSVRYVESHGHIERDAEGRALRMVGLSRDITQQKLLVQALDLAEQRWQLAIEGTNDSVWDWDVVTGQVYHDERWARMLGYDPGEIVPTNEGWKALAHPDDLGANELAVLEHFAQRTPFYQHELRMRCKDGSWRWILDRGRVVRRAADGRPLRMAGTHTDITARKQLEERLHKTEELANEVSRLAQIGGWEIDLVGARVTWTEGTRRIYEVEEHFQPTLENLWHFFPPEALAVVQTALYAATPSAPSFDVEVNLFTARGRKLRVRMIGHGEFHQGKAVSVRGAIQDVTARHQSEESRRELESQLFQAQKMETLGTLAGGIAHDFNNLLTGIIGYHELAADSLPEDHPARMCLHEARNASLRARELVEQILTFGRQSSGGEHAPIDLSLVVEEARRFLRATLPANITIDVHCDLDCGAVLADATQIHQVILNLGSNAAHAMRHHGGALRISLAPAVVTPELAVTLGASAASGYVRLSVSDTGHGMDESTRRRIFDPFFTTKNTREGTGLGLAVVHGIVRSHRGAIDVDSTPGSGTTFHIYLPTAAEDNPAANKELAAAPRGGGEYVCVVDDEEVVGSCTKLVLESRGYRTLIFASAEACLEELQANPTRCAVLVTDQTMPGMQGTELAAAMRKLSPGLPIVIMSGYFSKISPQALDELGQIELLAKPFTTDELAHAVHRALHPAARA